MAESTINRVKQTNKTILFEEFRSDRKAPSLYNLIQEGHIKTSDLDDLEVHSFKEFLDKFKPKIYEICQNVDGNPVFSYTADEEKVFLRDYLCHAMARHSLDKIEVFIWDHNKERLYERVRDTVDDTTKDMVAGAAFHWYSGDHFEALDMVHQNYPKLKLITSESCIEYSKMNAGDDSGNAAKLAHEVIGDLNHGINAFYDWNLLLDETGGPNHVNNLCHAPFLYDRVEKTLHPQLLQRYFWHFSHTIIPGSVRIGLTRYTNTLEACAFRRPDGLLAVVLFNAGTKSIPVHLRLDGELTKLTVTPKTIISGLIV